LLCIVFFILLLILLISHFYPCFFVKVLLVFNFILQSKFMLFYFFLIYPPFLLLSFPFVKVFFLFNLTLKFKFFWCPQIYFVFYPHSFNYNFLCGWLFFQIYASVFDLFEISLHDFFICHVFDLMTRVTSFKS